MKNEIEIIKKAVDGDEGAWEQIHKKYEKALFSYIKFHYSSIDEMDAEDILQETWENIIKKEKLKSFDPQKSSLYRYLLNITKYEILHFYDRKNKKFRIHGEDYRLILINETDFYPKENDEQGLSVEERLSILFYSRFVEHNDIVTDDFYTLIELFPHGGPPHQILAFGFNRLLSHWRKKPKKISDELSREFLQNLTDLFIEDFIKEIHTQIPGKTDDSIKNLFIKDYFKPLMECMNIIVAEVLSERDNKTHYNLDLTKIAGKTLLMEYYTGKPEKHISDWTDKVMKRLTKLWEKAKVKQPGEVL